MKCTLLPCSAWRRSEPIWRLVAAILLAATCSPLLSAADDPVFSGPQVGEKLPGFEFKAVLPESAKGVDLVARAESKPLCLIFVHGVTRPSIGLTRAAMNYASSLTGETGLVGGVVFLSDDATAMQSRIKRMSHALPENVVIGVSQEGQEGPGAYGLNRNVTMTVLIGKEGKVTANFAIIDPSLAVDLKKIVGELAKAAGVEPPSEQRLRVLLGGRNSAMRQDPMLRQLLRPVIQKDATDEQLDKAVAAVEAYIQKQPAAGREIGQIAQRIIDAGKLENYGSPAAQKQLRMWAEKYGKPAPPVRKAKPPVRKAKPADSKTKPADSKTKAQRPRS